MKLNIHRVEGNHQDFIKLVDILNSEQALRNGDKNDFYMQFNTLDNIDHAVIAYHDDEAIGCGALRNFDDQSLEIKRMFTKKEHRGKGVAQAILNELENWISELGYTKSVLETGTMNPEAVQFYKKQNYLQIPCFGPYANDEDSICFEKYLKIKD